MTIDEAVADAIAGEAGEPVRILGRRSLGGGCINNTERLDTTAGPFVLKTNPSAPAGLFRGEAHGLAALRQSGSPLTIPRVIGRSEQPQWLLLEYIGESRSTERPTTTVSRKEFDEALGAGLARLHQSSAHAFGFDQANYCGLTPQPNEWQSSWVGFYGTARLGHQVILARNHSLLDADDVGRLEGMIDRLDQWISEPASGPALIHGDLWSGNLHSDHLGGPALLDPAAYYAHREAEFGMMTLFGGFTDRVFATYDEAFPLEPGWRDRNGLYQLYHLLNHLNLFGRSYYPQVMNLVRKYR